MALELSDSTKPLDTAEIELIKVIVEHGNYYLIIRWID